MTLAVAAATLSPASPARTEPAAAATVTSNVSARSTTITFVTARVVRWSDGDTVVTNRGTVRLIGVDTPEIGRCGAAMTKRLAQRLAPAGSRIRLGNPSSVRNRDRYDRLLRYVGRSGTDIGARQIRAGARARYDSRTGYDWHPRQRYYISLDRQYALKGCATSGTRGGPYPPPGDGTCPSSAPIKGNRGDEEWIYHMPGQQYYAVTNPEECFSTEDAAQRAGYRRALI